MSDDIMLPVWRVERQKKPTRTTVVTGRRNQLVDEGRPNMSASISFFFFFFFNKVIDEDDRIWPFVFFQSANPNVAKETTTTNNSSDWRYGRSLISWNVWNRKCRQVKEEEEIN